MGGERYHAGSRALQDRFDTRRLGDAVPECQRGPLAEGVLPAGDPAADRAT